VGRSHTREHFILVRSGVPKKRPSRHKIFAKIAKKRRLTNYVICVREARSELYFSTLHPRAHLRKRVILHPKCRQCYFFLCFLFTDKREKMQKRGYSATRSGRPRWPQGRREYPRISNRLLVKKKNGRRKKALKTQEETEGN